MQSIFKTTEGKTVIAQFPNTTLCIWLAFKIATYLPISENLVQGANIIAFGSIFTWAYLEITSGVNAFRRVLGVVVLLGAVWMQVSG